MGTRDEREAVVGCGGLVVMVVGRKEVMGGI
jgi:hypothetical protein